MPIALSWIVAVLLLGAPEEESSRLKPREPRTSQDHVPRWKPSHGSWIDEGPRAPGRAATLEERARALHLRARGDGAYVYRVADEPFSAVVWPDGRVDFEVRRWTLNIERLCIFVVCVPLRKRMGAGFGLPLTSTTESLTLMQSGSQRDGATIDSRDATARAAYPPITALGLQGRFGRRSTPVRAMVAFLERTHDFRLALALQTTRRQLERARQSLPQQLVWRWQKAGSPEAARAEILALWTDVEFAPVVPEQLGFAPDDYEEIDRERRRAAAEARAKIVKFVRQHAPAESPQAFTAEELERFNGRADRLVKFEPYAAPPDVVSDTAAPLNEVSPRSETHLKRDGIPPEPKEFRPLHASFVDGEAEAVPRPTRRAKKVFHVLRSVGRLAVRRIAGRRGSAA